MFHKVVWQHNARMQGVMGFLIITLLQSSSNKKCKSVKIWQNCGHEFVASLFRHTLCIVRRRQSFQSVADPKNVSVDKQVNRYTVLSLEAQS